MKKTILFAASIFAAMSVWSKSTVVDGVTWYYSTYTSGTTTYAQITSGADKYVGKLKIPSSLDGYAVARIGSSAFRDCLGLMEISLPDTIVAIFDAAFCGCSSLTSIVLPAELTSIGDAAFNSCTSLVDVSFPDGLKSIGKDVFRGCPSLTDMTLPEGLKSIGGFAFYECKSLTRIDIPSTVETIGAHMIRGCDKLKTITVAAGNVNYKVANNCLVSMSGSTLVAVPFGSEEVNIPIGVTGIPDSIFYDDDNLVRVTIPAGVTSIAPHAFRDCDSLQSVEVPAGCTKIEGCAFYDCDAIARLSLPAELMSIGENAFRHCNLSEVVLPASVMAIGNYAFWDGNCTTRKVVFLGAPLNGVLNSGLLSAKNISYPREYGAQWLTMLNDISKFHGYNRLQPTVLVLSSQIRIDDPTILDVVYQVTSTLPTVKVRALAFEDGERSFAKVVRPETFVADTNGVETAGNIGDAIVPNVPHTLSWRVSSDWSNRLAKVSFEVLATEGELLPLEVRTIPASDAYGKMDVTWNAISESQWFDALLWLYADKCEKLSVRDGVCFYDGKMTATDTTLNYNKTASSYYSRTYNSETKQYDYVRFINTPEAVLDAMGYKVLSDEVLNYVNEETRLGLSPSGFRQYGWKIVE